MENNFCHGPKKDRGASNLSPLRLRQGYGGPAEASSEGGTGGEVDGAKRHRVKGALQTKRD